MQINLTNAMKSAKENEVNIKMLVDKSMAQSTYVSTLLDQVNNKVVETEHMLQLQIFSQTMMETLINDLLDLTKLENDQFAFNKEYFNLSTTIYESFQILSSTAKSKGITLQAQIDKTINLNMIQSIFGDERRYQ